MKLIQQGTKESKIPSPRKLTLIAQGAEAKIFLNEKENLVIKDRISKSYRNPELDKKIIKQRTKAERKLLTKANQLINSPLPENSQEYNKIIMPFIKGEKLSEYLNDFPFEKQKKIMQLIGESIAKIHKEDIIHGDLTTSNMILVDEEGREDNYDKNYIDRDNYNVKSNLINSKTNSRHEVSANALNMKRERGNTFQIFFIDFGLGYISKKVEDKAVDLHLLKQALEAKHFQHWKELFEEFKKAYSKDYSESKKIFERVVAVEKRGRYRH